MSENKGTNEVHSEVVDDATTTTTIEQWESNSNGVGGKWVNFQRTTVHTVRKVNFER